MQAAKVLNVAVGADLDREGLAALENTAKLNAITGDRGGAASALSFLSKTLAIVGYCVYSGIEIAMKATSSAQPDAVLTVVGFGEMTFKKNKYELKQKPVAANPGTVTVTSSLGGSATRTVKVK